jgi:hypothetical protein
MPEPRKLSANECLCSVNVEEINNSCNPKLVTMNKPFAAAAVGLAAITMLTGCLNLQFGGGTTTRKQGPSIGQQLMDLDQAKAAGAISETEYQTLRAKIIGE